MKNLMLLLLLAGCTSPASPPTATPAESAVADSIGLAAEELDPILVVMRAPWAVSPSDGPFNGRWYRKLEEEAGMEYLSVGHDTLGRYLINLGPTNNHSYRSVEAFTAYTSGDSLLIFGNPDHHSPAMGLHLGARRQRIILSYETASLMDKANPFMVRDTFWLDSLRVRR